MVFLFTSYYPHPGLPSKYHLHTHTFSLTGVFIWLALVIVLAAFASFLPAWNASRITVREVLAYE